MTSSELLDQKLRRILEIWDVYHLRLKRDKLLAHLLRDYLDAFAAAEKVHQETGLSSYCARCGREGRSSCCGEDMEFRCEDVLLLANLLAGVSFPDKRYSPKGCYFLGQEGCLLLVRPLICRNFICPELATHLGKTKLKQIQQALGPEAEALFRLCERLRRLVPEI
jgi:hypothetical protein